MFINIPKAELETVALTCTYCRLAGGYNVDLVYLLAFISKIALLNAVYPGGQACMCQ